MLILPFQGKTPRIHRSAWIAPNATIIGDVTIGPDSSVFYGCVLRGDVGTIRLGARVNVQDNCVIHVESTNPCILEDDVTVGHMAMLHGTQVGAGTLVGMKATLLSGSTVGAGSLIAAGAVVLEGQEIPGGCLAAGVPAKIRRELSDEESAAFIPHAAGYVELSKSQAQIENELSLESVLYD
ncbi:gamma carbonic anhydrase family protein [Corynebacterium minutissimum]|uniref:Gamma carbonic anhydrase family protein n=1 Tax=Corynebacterium minutissimum TaxID=38301 RepID=A0A2X4REU6_9CORY|nr:gamma carbonic anhydrase family protein [Corynebacterium minutissimum]KHO29768.1 acetyltransferase [Corynebacterium minutissimum]MCG7229348.1 gamma carbonic anhydrase family protein [Corynebacterium minutissimum]MCG7238338.1 gamma carbonic anhydrase family protein [Corynebacterium minutissimum]QPS60751.1 gamma carbonic anhydrase family protein [Corynebacterium minutissimum]QQA78462.1 gamma carbonic anhydrase family protein [Corynebacterium minutissimum]